MYPKFFAGFTACLILSLAGVGSSPGQEKEKFKLHSAFMGAGISAPSLDYWNQSKLPEINSAELFSWNARYGGYIDYTLIGNLRSRWGVSHWTDEVTPGNLEAFKSLKISITTFSVGLLYGYHLTGFDLYGGVKGGFFLVQNNYSILKGTGNLTDREQGQDYSMDIILGINKEFPFGLLAGLEFDYAFGHYGQEANVNGQAGTERVSLRGPYAGVNVGWRFKR